MLLQIVISTAFTFYLPKHEPLHHFILKNPDQSHADTNNDQYSHHFSLPEHRPVNQFTPSHTEKPGYQSHVTTTNDQCHLHFLSTKTQIRRPFYTKKRIDTNHIRIALKTAPLSAKNIDLTPFYTEQSRHQSHANIYDSKSNI